MATAADQPFEFQSGETRAAGGAANRLITALTPDLRRDPRAALRDMRVTEPLRSAVQSAAASTGLSFSDDGANDEFADAEGRLLFRQFSVLRSTSEEVVLLQIPEWIANDGANVGALTEVRDALANRKVRIVAVNVDAPDFSLGETMPRIWRTKANIDLKFVSWKYLELLRQKKRSAAEIFGLGSSATPSPAAAAMKKVFISSTGRDLANYRQAALEICIRHQLMPLMMEYFEAMSAGATAGSKAKLDEAHLYVGIFAHRYGYVEDGYDKSVTELEFDHAVARGLQQLCFVVDITHPWPQDATDPEHYKQMRAFKERVNKLIRAEFTSVDDFRVKLQHALLPHIPRESTSSS